MSNVVYEGPFNPICPLYYGENVVYDCPRKSGHVGLHGWSTGYVLQWDDTGKRVYPDKEGQDGNL